MNIDNSNGWTEALIAENCSTDQFLKIAGILQSSLDTFFENKINDTDSIYWDFTYKQTKLTLHYNSFAGVSIFPKSMSNATNMENQVVIDISRLLSNILDKLYYSENFSS